jgi:hypothetical protein
VSGAVKVVTHKACTKCQVLLTIDAYEPRAGAPDGRRSQCRDCRRRDRKTAICSCGQSMACKAKQCRQCHTKSVAPNACPTCNGEMIQRIRDGKPSGWVCRSCANDKSKAYRINQPERYLDNKLWTFYRIRLIDFRKRLAAQNNCCAACGIHRSQLHEKYPRWSRGYEDNGLVIDHDHRCCGTARGGGTICGECIRGLLCQGCNVALGMIDDDPRRLTSLLSYVISYDNTDEYLNDVVTWVIENYRTELEAALKERS